ncbi:MAG: hypothetical protein EOM40_01615 [Clostridia bacterium]|nr:hypothetical protein [Clostridia bacterium]
MNKKLIVRKYNLKCDKRIGQANVKIVFLSDLHNQTEGKNGDEIMRLLKECQPDLVLVGGDVMIGKANHDVQPAIQFMKRLSQIYSVWYANGNHEKRITLHPEEFGDMGACYDREIEKLKISRLLNQKVDLEVRGIPFTIYGFDLDEKFYHKITKRKGMKESIEAVFSEPANERYTILLAHNPRYGQEYLDWGADLTLSGHYHGGVMLLGKKRGAVTPDFRIFSKYCCGLHQKKDSSLIISAGIGEHTIPVRIHNPRELTLIDVNFS